MMRKNQIIRDIIESRKPMTDAVSRRSHYKREDEGGCGVTGFACSVPVRGKHIFEPSKQMHNRGNGRGGGIAAMGFDSESLGVSREILEQDYILQIAVLRDQIIGDLENRFIRPLFRVHLAEQLAHVKDYRDIPGQKRPGRHD